MGETAIGGNGANRMISYEGKHFVFVIGYIGDMGGAERQAFILATTLREKVGARVSFLGWSHTPGLMSDKLDAAGIEVNTYPLDWNHRLTWRKTALAKATRLVGFTRFTRTRVKPDFLLPYVGVNSKVAGLIWRGAGARYAWWNQRDEGREIYGSRLDRYVLRNVSDVVSNSWEGKRFLVETCGVDGSRVRVLNNAVPLPVPGDGSQWRERLRLGADDRLMVMAANLTKWKDHETLLRAFAITRSSPGASRYHLALAGRFDERGLYLKSLAFDLGLSGSVDFLGPVSDMSSLYSAADMIVHSSVTEGCPNAVLEGMSHAKCVVGTDISGLRQALGDDAAEDFLAAPRDPHALAQRITRYLADDEARHEAGARNRARIALEFSTEKLCSGVLDGISAHALPG